MKRQIAIACGVLLFLLLSGIVALALNGYELNWYVIGGGGGAITGGGYAMDGTVGQPTAGTVSGGSYGLNAGFWQETAEGFRVFLPVMLKG